ncbi:biosynthetic arginine decarboxylase [Lentilitoribacter sp. EG35]|uniref:biosynthetic arginine decarboxylase n=1 Tax=Lentilitoribacter sp. EG35 TaxID=3234192 RepID=UPI0034601B3D
MSEIDDSDIYGVDRWGDGYVTKLGNGELGLLNPLSPDQPPISLPSIIANLEARGIQTPVLIRVASYLKHSLNSLNDCFANAIKNYKYKGVYRGVFPIKVNQQAQVIDRITEYGRPYNFGLEAGSKPELVIALSQKFAPDALIICNGVKDKEFIELAIRARQLGFNVVLVLESMTELNLVIEVAKELDQEPQLGVRIKLTHQVGGNWAESSGDRSTFGLSISQLVDVIDRLKKEKLLHCLVLQHSHLGSQIPNVNDVRRAVTEACRVFISLSGEGVPLSFLDLGGGLGIDYTGQKTSTVNSTNYTMAEYCTNVVEAVGYAMDEAGLAHPTLVTESGRAVVAHSSFLAFSVLETTDYQHSDMPELQSDDHHFLSDLTAIKGYLSVDRLQECFNDARYYRDELRTLFSYGNISIREMARAEKIFLHVASLIKALADKEDVTSDEMEEKFGQLVDIYHCNFSLFQSLPDVWAIDQLHPIVPLQRLNEPPTRKAILSDITCDSDGKIDNFIMESGDVSALPLHAIDDDEAYYLGVFFIGAYQETLGDLHNLFGDTNVVTIDFDGKGGFNLLNEVEGDSISDVLSYVEYDPKDCIDAFKETLEQAVDAGKISVKERKSIMLIYKNLMNGYTYFESADTL